MRDAFGRFGRVVLLGGGSEIGQAIVRELLRQGPATVVLAAREPGAVDADSLTTHGATVERVAFDATDAEAHASVFDEIFGGVEDVDVVIVAFGLLGEQAESERDPAAAVAVATTNYTGAVSALTHAAERLRAQGHGSIVVLSSVAGQRARRSNYVYGSSKAGLDSFVTGLQLSLAGSGVHVLLVRPGFVRTQMTAGMKPLPLAVRPAEVGAAVAAALQRGDEVLWVPAVFRYVMWIVRALPRGLLRFL